MILSFGDRRTEELFHGHRHRPAFPPELVRIALRKLDALNAAHNLDDLRSPPGNRLEALVGPLAGFHSIRVNDQWRLVFLWTDAGVHNVRITDYH